MVITGLLIRFGACYRAASFHQRGGTPVDVRRTRRPMVMHTIEPSRLSAARSIPVFTTTVEPDIVLGSRLSSRAAALAARF